MNMENIFSHKVSFGDTDAAGIVFYPNFYRWMDMASSDYIGNLYLPVSKLIRERGTYIPLLETFCKFSNPLYFEDEFEVHTRVVEMGNKTIKFEHVFKRDDTHIASGYEVRAWVHKIDGNKYKAIPIPDEVRAAFGFGELTKK
jgi:4-hydroxybenzoyl-CoA thioesterase